MKHAGTINIRDIEFDVQLWKPGDSVVIDEHLGVDTETEPIESGVPLKPVCIQTAAWNQRIVQIACYPHIHEYFEELLRLNTGSTFYMHNAPFDCRVLKLTGTKKLVELINNKRLVDTSIRFILHSLRKGRFTGKFSLDTAAWSELRFRMAGKKSTQQEESVRMSFRQGMKLDAERISYAAVDPAVTVILGCLKMPNQLPTEGIQIRGYFGLDWISENGMLVDSKRLNELKTDFETRLENELDTLSCYGYYPGEEGNQTPLQKAMHVFERQTGVKLPRTAKKGDIQVNAATEEAFLSAGSPIPAFVKSLREAEHCTKMLSTYLNEKIIGADNRVHPNFSPLVKTGRTSCSKPNIQNVPRKEGLREIYVPKSGHLLFANDYSQIELCALAQSCYNRFGYSRMRELINNGEDLHHWFGQIIKKNDKRPESEKSTDKEYRQLAKVPNFGLPGGLGAAKLVAFAHNNYNVEITLEEAYKLKELWLEAFPEMADHLKPKLDQTFSNDDEQWYIAKTINGRVSRKSSYNSACNYPFQGLVADGGKIALWKLYQEQQPMVNFVHDEIIFEFPEDDEIQQRCRHVDNVMIWAMKKVIPDVAVRTEGALMRRWYKEAEEIRGYQTDKGIQFCKDGGDILIWTPRLQELYDEWEKAQKDLTAA